MPVSIISGGEIAFHWPTQKTNSRGFKVGLNLKTNHILNTFSRLRFNSKPWQSIYFLKSSKTEDCVKMLVFPITVLKFDTGGLNLPPAGECQGSLEKK